MINAISRRHKINQQIYFKVKILIINTGVGALTHELNSRAPIKIKVTGARKKTYTLI